MRIIFTAKLNNMTVRYFLQQPMSAIVNNIIKKNSQKSKSYKAV